MPLTPATKKFKPRRGATKKFKSGPSSLLRPTPRLIAVVPRDLLGSSTYQLFARLPFLDGEETWGSVVSGAPHRELHLTPLRRFAALFVVSLATACHFSFDRDLAPGDLQGRVLVASAGGATQNFIPADGAWVKLAASGLALRTDANGRFVIRGLGAGSYGLNVTFD